MFPHPIEFYETVSVDLCYFLSRRPQSSGSRDLVLRVADIRKPLTKESYKKKFVKLLLWEENEQRLALRKW